MNLVLVGHVDHGKSTLLARLLVDAGAVPESKLAELEIVCKRRSSGFELSFLLDAFQIERDQAVSIDSTRVWFSSERRRYAVADAPGHFEFLRHVVTGAADASLAVLVIDAAAGVGEQTERHAAILSLIGINDVMVAVNKMDLVGRGREQFEVVRDQAEALLANQGLRAYQIIPTVAPDGDNVVRRSGRMPWYEGDSVLEALDRYEPLPACNPPLRLPVQDVYRVDSERLVAGNVQGGLLAEGDLLLFSPSGLAARVAAIRRFPEDRRPAADGDAIALTLDRDVFVEPGNVASRPEQAPYVTSEFAASVFWFGRTELPSGTPAQLRLGTFDVAATVATKDRTPLPYGDFALIDVKTASPLPLDVDRASALSRFALLVDGKIAGAGVVRAITASGVERLCSPNVESEYGFVSRDLRERRFGHHGGVIWLTGLPSSGKSTIAKLLEQRLFAHGWNACVLDGDTLRTGLTGDLGFSVDDRRESVRRVAEVAALFAGSGLIAIVALVSPNERDREGARLTYSESFHEIYVASSVAVCEQRDAKDLYRRARIGEIPNFTGVSAAYEAPIAPELTLDTARLSAFDCVDILFEYVTSNLSLTIGA